MLKGLYAFRDIVASQDLGPLLEEANDAVAIRLFHDVLLDDRSVCGKHPEDFVLVKVGSRDALVGTVHGFYEGETVVVATGAAWAAARPAKGGPTLA